MRALVVLVLLATASFSTTLAYGFTYEVLSAMLGTSEASSQLRVNSGSRRGSLEAKKIAAASNGGAACAGCTLAAGIIAQTMQHNNQQAAQALNTLCGHLPSPLDAVCGLLGPIIGPFIFPSLDAKESPDAVCNTLGLCKAETSVCRLFPTKKNNAALSSSSAFSFESEEDFIARVERLKVAHGITEEKLAPVMASIRQLGLCNVIPGLCGPSVALAKGKEKDYKPAVDDDKDSFSTIPLLRGSDWRGKDCNDKDASTYPGRASADSSTDGNCNGIYGVNPASGLNFEDELCGGTKSMGVATLGDSASAHFRLPEQLLDVTRHSKALFAGLIDLVANSADYPQLSWATGHQNTSKYAPLVEGPMMSVYSLLREHNACNHRDYQNIGVNGADSRDLPAWVDILARNRNTDKPILAFFAMVGNDVCGRQKSIDAMTTPEEYYASVLEAVRRADAKLPKGSHVVLFPLVDGRILYDAMHAELHPIGQYNKDVTFETFYDYLNCLDMSPCWGWMNSDATVRNLTFAHTSKLNAQLPRIVAETAGTLSSITVHFAGSLLDDVVGGFKGRKADLIEPVDGFHPSQLANALLGNVTFHKLKSIGVIPIAPNPNNAAILRQFGDQGGY